MQCGGANRLFCMFLVQNLQLFWWTKSSLIFYLVIPFISWSCWSYWLFIPKPAVIHLRHWLSIPIGGWLNWLPINFISCWITIVFPWPILDILQGLGFYIPISVHESPNSNPVGCPRNVTNHNTIWLFILFIIIYYIPTNCIPMTFPFVARESHQY